MSIHIQYITVSKFMVSKALANPNKEEDSARVQEKGRVTSQKQTNGNNPVDKRQRRYQHKGKQRKVNMK